MAPVPALLIRLNLKQSPTQQGRNEPVGESEEKDVVAAEKIAESGQRTTVGRQPQTAAKEVDSTTGQEQFDASGVFEIQMDGEDNQEPAQRREKG